MSFDRVVSAATTLATRVGPLSTLEAMQELEAALADVDAALSVEGVPSDGSAIDVREARTVLDELPRLLAVIDVRIADVQSALAGR